MDNVWKVKSMGNIRLNAKLSEITLVPKTHKDHNMHKKYSVDAVYKTRNDPMQMMKKNLNDHTIHKNNSNRIDKKSNDHTAQNKHSDYTAQK